MPVVHGPAWDLGPVLDAWLGAHADGIACVIGDPGFQATSRVRSLPPELSKGLEFDLVVLVDPETFGTGIEGAAGRYVAMTRATQRLVVLTSPAAERDVRSRRSRGAVQPRAGDLQVGQKRPGRLVGGLHEQTGPAEIQR